MRTSGHGIQLIEGREGIRLTVYRDTKGIPTVGVGHVCLPSDNLKVGDKITQAQCDAFLAADLKKAEDAVNSLGVSLSLNEFDSLVSFTVNIGTNGFKGSTVAKRLKAGDHNGAAQAMLMWKKPPEIIGRRRSEVKQFLTPYSATASVSDGASIPPAVETTSLDSASEPLGTDSQLPNV